MKILICDYKEPMDRDLNLEINHIKKELPGTEIECYLYDGDKQQLFNKIKEVDALITAYLEVDEELLLHAPNLRMVSIEANGYNSVDLEAIQRHGVGLTCIEEYCTNEVADHTLTLALSVIRKINCYQNDMRVNKVYLFNNHQGLFHLEGKVWGIIGYGKIGRAVAKRAKAFGCKVIAYDPYLKKADVPLVELEELYQTSSIISLHTLLNEETYHMINKESLSFMKEKPVIINVGRGSLIDEIALIEALDNNIIYGAGLDVFENEESDVLAKSPFLERLDVVITPHIAFYSDESMEECARITAYNTIHYLKNEFDKIKRIVYKPN